MYANGKNEGNISRVGGSKNIREWKKRSLLRKDDKERLHAFSPARIHLGQQSCVWNSARMHAHQKHHAHKHTAPQFAEHTTNERW